MMLWIVLAPAAAALIGMAAPRREQARIVALGACLAVLALAGTAVGRLASSGAPLAELAPDLGSLGHAPLLALDGVAAPWIVAAALIALVVVAASPRSVLGRANIAASLGTLAATEGVLLSRNVALTALLWVLALVPCTILVLRAKHDRSHAWSYGVVAIGASVPMIAAAIALARLGQRYGLAAPLDLDALAATQIPSGEQTLPFALIVVSVAIRMGLFPFHAWVPALAQRGPAGVVGLLVGLHTGIFVLAKVVLPILPDASAAAMPSIAVIALVACLACAVAALAQDDLARTLGLVACSKAGMLFVGVASLESSSLHGALLESVGSGIAFVGVLTLIRTVEARCGTRDVRRLGGLVSHMPRASAAFFVLAAATVGFPGSIAFVGEDLLVHGVLDAHPAVAAILLFATALNGIVMFRAFCRAFLGRPAARPRTAAPPLVDDLVPRERLATGALIVLLVAFGLAPRALLGARRAHVEQVTREIRQEPTRPSFRHEGGPTVAR